MRVFTTLRPDGAGGCVLRNEVTATPRNILGYAAIPIEIGILSARRFGRAFRYYAELARREAGKPLSERAEQRVTYLRRPGRLAPGGAARLEGMRTTLHGQCPRELVAALIAVVRRADDLAVARVRPYVLADLWHVPRRAVVDVCLCATRAGNRKAGIHFGPCIVVTLNERLDYFGSTVNIAARLGALSQGGELIISESVARDPEVQSLLQDSDIAALGFQAQLKGYEGTNVPLLCLHSTRLIPPTEIISV